MTGVSAGGRPARGRSGIRKPVRIDGRDYLTTAQVAAYLGGRPQTIYAYVSRGILRRTTIRGQRGSFFALAEVEDVASRARAPRSAGAADRIHTQITLVAPEGRLAYRGVDVADLVRSGGGFERACEVLWEVSPAPLAASPADAALVTPIAACLPPGARSVDLIRLVVDVLGAADPLRGDLRPEAVVAIGGRIIGAVVDALLGEAGSGPIARRLRWALTDSVAGERCSGDRSDADRLVDSALALLADHDLAMSTRAARVAASARAHPYAVVASALAAMDSPLHGTAPRAAYRLLGDALADPSGTVADLVSGARTPVGFGHRIYTEGDPRADALLDLIRESGSASGVLETVDLLVDAAVDRLGTFPNSDFALAVLAHRLGLRAEAGEVIFAVARIAGWIAHAVEEYAADPLRYRLAGVYTGIRPPG